MADRTPESPTAYADRRAVEIADRIVPAYRAEGSRYSCTGQVARCWEAAHDGALAVLAPRGSLIAGIHVVENTDGEFAASFATSFLADCFVDEGSGCYRHRVEIRSSGARRQTIGMALQSAGVTVPLRAGHDGEMLDANGNCQIVVDPNRELPDDRVNIIAKALAQSVNVAASETVA